MTGAPDAGDTAFWDALGIPEEMRASIVQTSAVVEVFPDNALALDLFAAMGTQWRYSFSGPSGLDYGVLPTVFDLCAVPPEQRADAFECLRVMESEALKVHANG